MIAVKTKTKKILTIDELIPEMEEKNIKFNIMNKEETIEYLKNNNNYRNLIIYKNNFKKYYNKDTNNYEDRYLNLEFAYLKDLAIIDLRVRFLILKMVIDIEHYLKINILKLCNLFVEEDGCRVVNLYFENDFSKNIEDRHLHKDIHKKLSHDEYKELSLKYNINKNEKIKDIPIWEFLEIISFGELIDFYEFFCNEYNINGYNVYILREIKKIRNASAHNTCILDNLEVKNEEYGEEPEVRNFLGKCGIQKKTRDSKMHNNRIKQITYVLYMFNIIVSSRGVKKNISEELNDLFYKRICKNKDYYQDNELLHSTYTFFDNIIKQNYKI